MSEAPSKRLRESVSVQRAAFDVLDVSESTIRRLIAGGAFPHTFRVGKGIRIPRSDLAAFVKAHQVSSHTYADAPTSPTVPADPHPTSRPVSFR